MKQTVAFSLLACVLFAACASTEQSVPPPPPTPKAAHTAELSKDPNVRVEEGALKLELSVHEAVEEGLVYNRTVGTAREVSAIAAAQAMQARAAMIPQIAAIGRHEGQDTAPSAAIGPIGSVIVGPKNVSTIEIAARWNVYAFGRYLNAYRAASLLQRQSEADKDATESNVAALVTAAVFDLLETIQQIEVARSNENALAQQVEDARAQRDAGRVTDVAVLEAEVEHDRARRDRERLESLVPIRRIVINVLLGRPTDTPTEIIDDPLDSEPDFDLTLLEEEALRNRPEIRSAQLGREAARRGVQSVIGSEIGELTASVGWHSDDNSFSSPNDFGFFALEFAVPIFRAGARKARIREARRQVGIAALVFADTVAQVRRDVAEAHRQVQQTYRDIAVFKRNVGRQTESLRIQREKFNAGRATSREMLDSNTLLTESKFEYVRSLYDYNKALQELHRASGLDPRLPPRTTNKTPLSAGGASAKAVP
ncbi:MAG: TolC family protein [Planctomycetota bacterium]|nr:TolC family protein [Planctomycetota bacterium]